MEILVCIKQVPDDSVEIRLNQETGLPDLEKATPVVNAFDTYALEMAARFTESQGGEITVFTFGPEKAKDALKSCLSVGAKNAYLCTEEAYFQSGASARAFLMERAIRRIEELRQKPFDLIFCGKESTDRTTGQTGPRLAEQMNLPCITNIIGLEKDGEEICARQETEEGYRRVEAPLPCLVTVTKPDYDPRYPTIKSKMAARKIPISELSLQDFPDVDSSRFGPDTSQFSVIRIYEPEKKQGGLKIREETPAESALRAVAMMAEAKLL